MNIVLATDENYAIPTAVCITSVFENHKNTTCKVYILTDSLSNKAVSMFTQLQNYYHQTIIIINVNLTLLNSFKATKRLPVQTYYRLVLPEYIKEDKVLYLDCDIVVHRNILNLYNTNLDGYGCGVVEDQRADDISLLNHLDLESGYFNAGVLLVNLSYWREHNIQDKLLSYIHNNPEKCVYNDQDALNSVLHNNVKYLDYAYNFQAMWFYPKDQLMIKKEKWPLLFTAKKNPAIVHFTKEKPWHCECNHPLRNWFIEYAKLHDFVPFKRTHYYSLPYRILMRLSNEVSKFAHNFR